MTRDIIGDDTEPFNVVRTVENHRRYWKPEQTRVILLAESHVYTTGAECAPMRGSDSVDLPYSPRNFVRFVYCLGYGENQFVGKKIENNQGTPQFWKIFASCAGKNDYQKYTVKGNRRFEDRVRAKVALLQKLKEMGVWLLDASILALYRPGGEKPVYSVRKKMIETCWDTYVGKVVRRERPEHVIVIGKEVYRILEGRLEGVCNENCVSVFPQPQYHQKAERNVEDHREYERICRRYCG